MRRIAAWWRRRRGRVCLCYLDGRLVASIVAPEGCTIRDVTYGGVPVDMRIVPAGRWAHIAMVCEASRHQA